jgi:hypothetical protein
LQPNIYLRTTSQVNYIQTEILVVLQKMNRDVKSPSCASIYAAIPKRFDTNLTCI